MHVREQKKGKTARHLHKSISPTAFTFPTSAKSYKRVCTESEARVNHFHNNSDRFVRRSRSVHPSLLRSMCFLMCARVEKAERSCNCMHFLPLSLPLFPFPCVLRVHICAAAAAICAWPLATRAPDGRRHPGAAAARWQNVRAATKNAAATATLSLSHLDLTQKAVAKAVGIQRRGAFWWLCAAFSRLFYFNCWKSSERARERLMEKLVSRLRDAARWKSSARGRAFMQLACA